MPEKKPYLFGKKQEATAAGTAKAAQKARLNPSPAVYIPVREGAKHQGRTAGNRHPRGQRRPDGRYKYLMGLGSDDGDTC